MKEEKMKELDWEVESCMGFEMELEKSIYLTVALP